MNEHYRQKVDLHRREKVFREVKWFMVHLRKERYPQRAYNKLKPKNIRPCQVLGTINNNAYLVELL